GAAASKRTPTTARARMGMAFLDMVPPSCFWAIFRHSSTPDVRRNQDTAPREVLRFRGVGGLRRPGTMKKSIVFAALLGCLTAAVAGAAGPDPRERNFKFFVDGVET